MRSKPNKTNVTTRLDEGTELRDVVKTSLPEKGASLGRFCMACDMYHSYMRQDDKLCRACNERLKTLYGNS